MPIYVDVDETTLERCRDLLGVAGPVLTVDDNFEPSRIAVRAPAEVVASN